MPSCLIEKNERMCSWRDRKRDFLEMQGHSLAVAGGQDKPGAFSFGRTDGSENIGRRRPLVARRGGPGSAFRPSPSDLVFLPDPGFILEPNLHRFAASLLCVGFFHDGGEAFLKTSAASSSCT
jgi:hypothetical protein